MAAKGAAQGGDNFPIRGPDEETIAPHESDAIIGTFRF
jgi:hypothetical protein